MIRLVGILAALCAVPMVAASAAEPAPAFVPMGHFMVDRLEGGEVVEHRAIALVIETREGGPHDLVLRQQLRLRDLFQRYLNALATRRGPENLDNLPYLKAVLRTGANDLLGEEAVEAVLIQSMQQRPAE